MSRNRSDRADPTAPAAMASMADLLRARGVTVRAQQPAVAAPPQSQPAARAAELARCGKLVVRRERKGHGGKTVTVVEGLGLPAKQLDEVARALRVALGCGSRVEDGRVVVQGDLAPNVAAWLRKRGATKIVVGN